MIVCHVCRPRIYRFKGWLFEYHSYLGGWPLKASGEPRKRAGDVFWEVFDEFCSLPDDQKAECRIDGRCLHAIF